ncbi:MAG: hypothetical protein K2Y01_00470 [Rhabdochlamydiaceae bacterium]|nr:hypothetical protein [Rhabdochlamydiaceae bacterium]
MNGARASSCRGIGYIKDLVNLRATTRDKRYSSVQFPVKRASSYSVYQTCMDQIKTGRSLNIEELEDVII